MSYRLAWLPTARDEMLRLILIGPDRTAIVGALSRISSTLEQEWPAASESREADFRVIFDAPLAAKFSVDEPDMVVRIADVWVA
jgi:hypothetical protein